MPRRSSWRRARIGSRTRRRRRGRRSNRSGTGSSRVSEIEPDTADEPELEGDDDETGPLRRCIASGERLDPEGMIRFVVGPEDRLVPDVAGKLPGRGIWVSADRDRLRQAVAKHLFARAA